MARPGGGSLLASAAPTNALVEPPVAVASAAVVPAVVPAERVLATAKSACKPCRHGRRVRRHQTHPLVHKVAPAAFRTSPTAWLGSVAVVGERWVAPALSLPRARQRLEPRPRRRRLAACGLPQMLARRPCDLTGRVE